jgi:hypothetical protein
MSIGPRATRLFVGHDHQLGGRAPRWESTVGEQKAVNGHVAHPMTQDAFAALREARDRMLPLPKLMLHALQVNIAGGRLPERENNGARYLKIPSTRPPCRLGEGPTRASAFLLASRRFEVEPHLALAMMAGAPRWSACRHSPPWFGPDLTNRRVPPIHFGTRSNSSSTIGVRRATSRSTPAAFGWM